MLVAQQVDALGQLGQPDQLGRPGPGDGGLLLRLDVTSADRPGLLDLILSGLQQEVADALALDPALTAPTVLYGFNQVADGRRSASRLMIRMPLGTGHANRLKPALQQVERSLRTAIIARPGPVSGVRASGRWQARPVVSLRLAELVPFHRAVLAPESRLPPTAPGPRDRA